MSVANVQLTNTRLVTKLRASLDLPCMCRFGSPDSSRIRITLVMKVSVILRPRKANCLRRCCRRLICCSLPSFLLKRLCRRR